MCRKSVFKGSTNETKVKTIAILIWTPKWNLADQLPETVISSAVIPFSKEKAPVDHSNSCYDDFIRTADQIDTPGSRKETY